jgi:hypothetical protein
LNLFLLRVFRRRLRGGIAVRVVGMITVVIGTGLTFALRAVLALPFLTVGAFAFFALIAVLSAFFLIALLTVAALFVVVGEGRRNRRESIHGGKRKPEGD